MFAATADGMQPLVRAGGGGEGRQFLATIMVLIVAVAPSATSTTTM